MISQAAKNTADVAVATLRAEISQVRRGPLEPKRPAGPSGEPAARGGDRNY